HEHTGKNRIARHVPGCPELIVAAVLVAHNQVLLMIEQDNRIEHAHAMTMRIDGLNGLDIGNHIAEVKARRIENRSGRHTAIILQPMIWAICGNSTINTSGRNWGSLSCSAVADSEARSPANSAVRIPNFLAGAMSRGRLEPTCST